jgi:hypothetical protein
VIDPTDEMVKAFERHFFTCFRDEDVRDALAAVLAIVERDYDVLPIPAEATSPEQEEICGAIYIDPDRSDRPPVAPCGKSLGHENGPTTDWKRGFHSNGMFKWPVES